ncbi:MAG: hypothetical protein JXR70_08150 [Spirochaetales bacterium]|nr:hypothetical protein [Spirochaetales bacterium]
MHCVRDWKQASRFFKNGAANPKAAPKAAFGVGAFGGVLESPALDTGGSKATPKYELPE